MFQVEEIARNQQGEPSMMPIHMRNLYAKLEVHSQSDLYLLLENNVKTPGQEEIHDRR